MSPGLYPVRAGSSSIINNNSNNNDTRPYVYFFVFVLSPPSHTTQVVVAPIRIVKYTTYIHTCVKIFSSPTRRLPTSSTKKTPSPPLSMSPAVRHDQCWCSGNANERGPCHPTTDRSTDLSLDSTGYSVELRGISTVCGEHRGSSRVVSAVKMNVISLLGEKKNDLVLRPETPKKGVRKMVSQKKVHLRP